MSRRQSRIEMERNAGCRWLVLASLLACLADGLAAAEADQVSPSPARGPDDFFLQKVHPLLEAKCFGCHGEEKDREADLDMRSREGLLKGGESGSAALVTEEPEKSQMYRAALPAETLKMPPKDANAVAQHNIKILGKT